MAAKILIVASWITKPDTAAGDMRFFAMLRILAKHNVVDFWVALEDPNTPELLRYKQDLQKIGVNVLKKNAFGLELALSHYPYDIVLFEFWNCADQYMNVARRQQPWAKIVIDSVDIHYLREEAGLAFGISTATAASASKQHEIATYQKADLVIVVTHEDRNSLTTEKVTKPLALVPMIVPFGIRERKQRDQELLFVGGFRHAPNADGLLWFVNKCWPLVRAQEPRATLTVIGSYPPQEVLDLDTHDGINVVGFVTETAPYLDNACLSIAPLRFGAGMKGKVTEAMAAGVPVVTTTFGAQGLNAISGKHLMVGDAPGVVAEHIIALLADPDRSESMGVAGQDHIKQLCSAEVVEKQLNEIVASLMAQITPVRFPLPFLTLFAYRSVVAGKVALFYFKKAIKKVIRKIYAPKRISSPVT